MVNITWLTPNDFTAVRVERADDRDIILRVGDFIKYDIRPDGVRIESFTSKESDQRGPVGMTYLPWRTEENRWATPKVTMKGNYYFIICYPVGMPHYGTHINWESVERLERLEHREHLEDIV